jgi:predicted transcriptional regulator
MSSTFNYSAPRQAPASAMQSMLLRLPRDLMTQLSRLAPNRGRNQFVVEALQRDLERREAESDAQLIAACEALNAYEAAHPELLAEAAEWDAAVLVDEEDDGFDRDLFEREFAIAQATRTDSKSMKAKTKATA